MMKFPVCANVVLVVALLLSCSAVDCVHCVYPSVVAHRGGSSLGPENTLLCIERAILVGADAVEVDVRLTADGTVVLMHDSRVDRTTDGCGYVNELFLADVERLRIVDSEGLPTHERVPTLAEVLSFVSGRCCLLIEIKDDDGRGVESAVASLVVEHDATDWVAVQSFSDAVLERFAALGVSFPLEKLFVFKVPFFPCIFDGTFRVFTKRKYSYVSSFNVHRAFLRKGLAQRVHSWGKEVKVWTLKDGSRLPRFPVDGVITDCPQYWASP